MTSTANSENGYQCDLCKRSIRVPVNRSGLDIINHCIITEGCAGTLHMVTTVAAKNAITAIPPEVIGLNDWFSRKILFTFDQTIERAAWTIAHNLGTKPVVQVVVNRVGVDGKNQLIELAPDQYTITIVDLNNIILNFTRPESGVAQCIGSASTNLVNPQIIEPVTVGQFTLSANGEVTLAVTDFSVPIAVTVTFLTSTTSIVEHYAITGTNAESPWFSTQQVFILGKKLTVVSFNLIENASDPSKFIDGSITSGDLVTMTFDNSSQATPNYILLTKSPYNFVDRITDQIVDVTSLAQFDSSFFYKPNSIVTSTTSLKNIYPPIVIVD